MQTRNELTHGVTHGVTHGALFSPRVFGRQIVYIKQSIAAFMSGLSRTVRHTVRDTVFEFRKPAGVLLNTSKLNF